jgi:hypothetical protein
MLANIRDSWPFFSEIRTDDGDDVSKDFEDALLAMGAKVDREKGRGQIQCVRVIEKSTLTGSEDVYGYRFYILCSIMPSLNNNNFLIFY